MIDTSIRARLRRLFSTQVIVRKVGANKIKVTDTSKLQAGGNPYGSTYVDRFAGLHTNRTMGVTGIGNAYSFHAVKTQLYTDYEAMDLDPIISSALDIYADESTTYSENNIVLEIKTEDARIQKILHNLFYDVLNVEYNLWPWVRNMCKYGDFYLYLDINEELGVVNVMPISAYELERQEGYDPENPYSVRFTFIGKNSVYSSNEKNTHFEYYEIAHFRMLSDTNFLPYGKSMIEGARKLFKQLVLMEDAMLLQRIMRAPERRIFKIDVGNIPPTEVDSHIQNIITKVKKVPYMDPQTGEYNLKFNMQNMLEDFYLPVRGSESGTSIETLPGLSNDGQIEDIEYLRNKMMAALKIPKAFLGYDEGIQGKCISPLTMIPLIDGRVLTVSDLIDEFNAGKQNYVYSLDTDTNSIVPGEIEWAGYTRLNTQIVRVNLDNGKYIECTPDHKFLTRNGEWIEAQDLNTGQALMPLYLGNGGYKKHYTTVYNPSTEKYTLVHRLVADHYNIKEDGKVIHHKDYNSRNNNPDNLDGSMTFFEHREFHQKNAHEWNKSPAMVQYRNSPQFLINSSNGGKKGGAKSAKQLGEYARTHAPVNKLPRYDYTCEICGCKLVGRLGVPNNKTCAAGGCISAIARNRKIGNTYNCKFNKVPYDILLETAKVSNSFKDLESKLGITRATLNRVFELYDINKEDFVFAHMPLALSNKGFMQNYRQYESHYANHTVLNVEWLSENIDTCDLTINRYHNFGTDAGVIIHNSTLAAEDVRFARTIERIQRIVISELYKIAVVHLYTQGFEDADLVNFELNLTSPSIIYERQKVELMKEKIDLANTLIESKLFSRKFIYENIFDMDQNGWQNEQELVVEDTKQEFRLEQIKSEGNDPKVTKQSYGTPHDIASMHVSSKYEDPRLREYVPGPGRPNAKTNFESDRDVDGPDPIGMKDVSDTFKVDTGMTKTPKTSSAFGENTKYIGSILHSMKQNKLTKSTSVAQTLNEHVEPNDTGTLLDESRLDSFNV